MKKTKKSKPITISHRQLTQALEAYDIAIEDVRTSIDGISIPEKNTAQENRDLARYRKELKALTAQQKQLEKLW